MKKIATKIAEIKQAAISLSKNIKQNRKMYEEFVEYFTDSSTQEFIDLSIRFQKPFKLGFINIQYSNYGVIFNILIRDQIFAYTESTRTIYFEMFDFRGIMNNEFDLFTAMIYRPYPHWCCLSRRDKPKFRTICEICLDKYYNLLYKNHIDHNKKEVINMIKNILPQPIYEEIEEAGLCI